MRNKQAGAPNSEVPSGSPHSPNKITADLQVAIPHRNPELTRAALRYVSSLANGLDLRLRLIDVHVVPYGVSLDEPTVNPKHLERRLKSLAQECPAQVSAEIVYARLGTRTSPRSRPRIRCSDSDQEILVAHQREEARCQTTKTWSSGHLGRVLIKGDML